MLPERRIRLAPVSRRISPKAIAVTAVLTAFTVPALAATIRYGLRNVITYSNSVPDGGVVTGYFDWHVPSQTIVGADITSTAGGIHPGTQYLFANTNNYPNGTQIIYPIISAFVNASPSGLTSANRGMTMIYGNPLVNPGGTAVLGAVHNLSHGSEGYCSTTWCSGFTGTSGNNSVVARDLTGQVFVIGDVTVAEPSSIALAAGALAVFGLRRRRKSTAKEPAA